MSSHSALPRRVWPFIPAHQVFLYINDIPLSLLFSSLDNPSLLSSCERCSSLLIVALCQTQSSMSISPFHWEAQHQTQHSQCVSPVQSRGKGSSPSTSGSWSACLSTRTQRSFSANLLLCCITSKLAEGTVPIIQTCEGVNSVGPGVDPKVQHQ